MRRTLITILSAALVAGLMAAPAVADAPVTIVDAVLAEDGEFDILQAAVLAVEGGGILPAATLLSGEGPFTVFAPTDKAFTKLAEDLSGDEFADEGAVVGWLVDNVGLETIAVVLGYHVVEAEVPSSAVSDGAEVETFGGESFTVFAPGKNFRSIQFVDNDPDARNPKLVKGLFDIVVDNGIIHGIDRVLRPIDL